jgi:hypothetical protein
MMGVTSVARFEPFFRAAAGLDIDKTDLKRYTDFINETLYRLLLSAQATAKANLRDIIDPHGHALRIMDPKIKNPQSEQWERCIRLFNELL